MLTIMLVVIRFTSKVLPAVDDWAAVASRTLRHVHHHMLLECLPGAAGLLTHRAHECLS